MIIIKIEGVFHWEIGAAVLYLVAMVVNERVEGLLSQRAGGGGVRVTPTRYTWAEKRFNLVGLDGRPVVKRLEE